MARVFAIDLRSLALFRIGLALALLADLALRSVDLLTFYGESGVLPVALARQVSSLVPLSLHAYASPWPNLLRLLFGVQLAATLALLVGFRARLAALVSWLLLVSLQLRNPLLSYSGGEQVLRLLLFWSMFLPLGARGNGRALGVPSAALLIQIALIYVSNGLNKLASAPWREGVALSHALELTIFAGPLGPWLATQRWLLAPGSWATIAFEGLAPLLAFVPWRNDAMRLGTVALFVGFHLFLIAAFSIGSFPVVCIVAWLVFLPPSFWDALARPSPRVDAKRPPRALEALCGALLAYVLVQVAAGHLHLGLPRPLRTAGVTLRLDQHWGQFARVTPLDSWPVLEGATASGAAVDPLLGGAPLAGRPVRAAERFPTFRWRIWFYGLIERGLRQPPPPVFAPLVAQTADALCRRWNATHAGGDALVRLRVSFVAQMMDSPSAPREFFALERACDVVR